MAIAVAATLVWLLVLTTALRLGAAAKRGDEIAQAAFDRLGTTQPSAVPSEGRSRTPDRIRTIHRPTRPVTDRCELCGAQR